MKQFFAVLFFTSLFSISFSQAIAQTAQVVPGLYVKTYGESKKAPLIFIHGGPGYDSQNFEYTTAQKIADKGFFVVIYDQRGQGRSDVVTNPEIYKYKAYADDLMAIINSFKIKAPVLIGHSHGGDIALKFEEYYPNVAQKIILVSAPVNFWSSMQNIELNCSKKYKTKKDVASEDDLKKTFQTLNTKGISLQDEVQYTSRAFQSAMKCGLYQPSRPTKESIKLNKFVEEKYIKPPQENLMYPMGNFIVYENYTHIDYSNFVVKNASKIFGIYGSDDGLFSTKTFDEIKSSLSTNKSKWAFTLINDSSHNVFIDQQEEFLKSIDRIVKAKIK